MINTVRGLLAAIMTVTALSVAAPAVAEPAEQRVTLPVKEAIAKLPSAVESRTGYTRARFRHWIDQDRDGCSTRAEVLRDEAVEAPDIGPGCKISGGVWVSYYDGVRVTDARQLDIDHMVPLAEAWDSGASAWTAEKRMRYANDLGSDRSLAAVTARSNRQKSDQDPATWWPSAESASCQYLADWVSTKTRWDLSVDSAEEAALGEYAARCPDTTITTELAE